MYLVASFQPIKLVRTIELTIFEKMGFIDQEDYFNRMAMDFEIPLNLVYEMASFLGDEELFDGLPSSLEGWRN